MTLGDNGATYRLVASNVASNISNSVTSRAALLTVLADTNRPVLLGARSLGLTQVEIALSEKVTAASATNKTNYALSGPAGNVVIVSAVLAAGQIEGGVAQGIGYALLEDVVVELRTRLGKRSWQPANEEERSAYHRLLILARESQSGPLTINPRKTLYVPPIAKRTGICVQSSRKFSANKRIPDWSLTLNGFNRTLNCISPGWIRYFARGFGPQELLPRPALR